MNPEDLEQQDIDDAVSTLMHDLPKPVRDFLLSNERGQVARELSGKYNLHTDQAGEFEQAYLYMLLGIATPEEFTASLRKTGLSEDVIDGLAADINTRVFMRLRDTEREASRQTVPVSLKPAPLPAPALEYQPANLPGSPVPAPMPAATTLPTPQAATIVPTPMPQEAFVAQPAPQQHIVHAMPSTQQPGWHPAAAVHIFVPTHGYGAPVMQTPSIAPASIATAPLEPSIATHASQPSYINSPEPSSAPSAPLVRDYAADPYREPVQ